MTALSVYPVCVGWGIASALGASARHTGFYLRAGRNNFSLSPFVDALGDAVTVSCVTTLPKDLAGPARLAALAASSLEEALMTIGEFSDDRRIRVYFVLPTRYAAQAGKSLNAEGNRVISALVEQSAFRRYRSEIEPMPLGAAGGARALVRAAQALGSNEIDLAILLGVDSYYDWPVLERLRKEDRLLTPDTVDGLRPGEAGACMVLVAPHHRFARSAGVSRFVAAGEGHEPSLPGVDSPPNMARGFTDALREAVAPLRQEKSRTNYFFSDVTHEDYRVRELQILIARFGDIMGQNVSMLTPARELGECGAATLPLYAALATESWHRGYSPGPTALCFAASEDGLRGAYLLQQMER